MSKKLTGVSSLFQIIIVLILKKKKKKKGGQHGAGRGQHDETRAWRRAMLKPAKPNTDYTTASNICLRISNKEYWSTRLRIRINSLGPRKPRCKFKSSEAPLAIKSDNYAECLRGPYHIYFTFS